MADYSNICDLYDQHLGLVLFKPYAKDLAKRVAGKAEGVVLEMACGTGILTQELRTHLHDDVVLVATDISQAMLDYSQAKLETLEKVEWHRADMAHLPFEDKTFAATICQFGLMFVEDKKQAFKEMHRVLVKDGLLVFNVWDCIENNPPIHIAHQVVTEIFPDNPPQFFQEPHAFHDIERIKRLLAESGFEQIELEVLPLDAHSPSVQSLATGLIEGAPILDEIQQRNAPSKPVVDAVATALSQHGGDLPFCSTMQAIIVTARAK